MTAIANASLPMPVIQKSPWHSPVPYLFGGLAAMLGLIAFALLILACSYWKLSGYLDSGEGSSAAAETDLEAGSGEDAGDLNPAPVFEEKFLVIMAGQEKPTYLATPISSRTSSFGSNTSCSTETTDKSDETAEGLENSEGRDQVRRSNMENHEASEQSR